MVTTIAPASIANSTTGGGGRPLRSIAMSIITVSFLFLLQQIVCGSHFETNDDFAHVMVLSGALPNTVPDAHLLTPNVLLSLVLKQLYSLVPAIPWYFLNLLAMQWLGAVALQWLLIKRLGTAFGIGAFAAFFVLVQSYILTFLQFTSTAIFAGSAGCLLLIELCCIQGCSIVLAGLTSAVLIGLSALLRYQSCLLSIALAIPVIFLARVEKGAARWVCLGWMLTAALLCLTLNSLNAAYFNSSRDWRSFYSTRADLTRLIDFGGYAGTRNSPVLRSAQWTENDGAMLQNFLYCDPEIFSVQRIKRAAAFTGPLRQDLNAGYVGALLSGLLCDRALWPAFAITMLSLPFMSRRSPLSAMRFFVFLALTSASIGLIVISMKLPARVYFPCTAFVSMVALLNLELRNSGPQKRSIGQKIVLSSRGVSRLAGVALSASLVSLAVLQYGCIIKPAWQLRKLERRLLARLNEMRQQHETFVVFGNAFPYEFLSPAANLRTVFDGISLIPTGGYNNSPWLQRLTGTDASSCLLKKPLRPGVTLISNEWFNQFYLRYLQEHCAAKAQMQLVTEDNKVGVKFYKVQILPDDSPQIPL